MPRPTMSERQALIDRLEKAVANWPSERTRRRAQDVIEALCSEASTLAVVAFGSAVRPTSGSFDLDLLYIFQGSEKAQLSVRSDIDVRPYAADKVEELVSRGHDLLCWSIKFGRCICERDSYWSGLLARWQDRLPPPSVQDARERAARSYHMYRETLSIGDLDAALEQYVTYLTHCGRIRLITAGIYPASRPELPGQLEEIDERQLASELRSALHRRNVRAHGGDKRTRQYLMTGGARS